MNKITDRTFSLSHNDWKRLLRYMFDDCESIDEGHFKHSEYFTKLVAEVDLDWATTIVAKLQLHYNRPEDRTVNPTDLVGTWMVEGTSSPNNGFYWDYVPEAFKVEKVVETITVTKWKPICDESPVQCSSEQPQSKVCLPQQ